MASKVLTNAYISLDNGSTDHSAFFDSVTINYEAELLEDTSFGDSSRSRVAGLKDWSIDLEVNQDYAASQIDSILFPLVGTSFTVLVNPDGSTTSSSNPEYTGTAFLESFQPIAGGVGELAESSIRLVGSGDLSRNES